MKTAFLIALLATAPLFKLSAEDGFTSLFNGTDMTGWKPAENPDTWTLQDGALVAHGRRSHLFYVGDFHDHTFRNFELKVDIKAAPKSNGGVYIMTSFEPGWPGKGFEIQVNNTYPHDPRKTFSIYEVKDVHEQIVGDDQWFTEDIVVKGDTITVKDGEGKTIVEWTQPPDWHGTSDFAGRVIGPGTIALQAHDPGSTVAYKNIRIKLLEP